jgi:hypothetical protein
MVCCLLHWVSCWSFHNCAALDETVSVSPSLVDKLRGGSCTGAVALCCGKKEIANEQPGNAIARRNGRATLPKSQKSDELPIIIFLTFGREVKRKPSFSLSRRNLPVEWPLLPAGLLRSTLKGELWWTGQ